MWPLFAVVGTVCAVAWLYGAVKVGTKAPPLQHDTFTAPGTIQVGDVVSVAMVSLDEVDREDSLEPLPNAGPLGAALGVGKTLPTANDLRMIDSMQAAALAGGLAKLKVTATGLKATASSQNPGVPVSIGVIVDPPLEARLPAVFLNASVQKIERNGIPVTV